MPCIRRSFFIVITLLIGACDSEVVNSSGEAGSAGQKTGGEGGAGGSTPGEGGQHVCANGTSMLCSCTCGGRQLTVEGCWEETCANLDGQRCANGTYEACDLAPAQPGGCCL